MKKSGNALLAWSSRTLAEIGAYCVIGMLLLISADVFARMIFASPLPAIVEIVTNWFMVGLVFLPLALIGRAKTHIQVETFTEGLSPTHLRTLNRAVSVLGTAFFGVLAYAGIDPALAATRIGETTSATVFDLPVWPVRWVVILAYSVAALVELHNALHREGRNE